LDLALIDESKAGYLDLAFSAKALAPNGSVDQILNDSKTYVAALSSRLRDRVYEDVVSRLSVAVAEKLRGQLPEGSGARLLGPIPAWVPKRAGRWRENLILRAADPLPFVRALGGRDVSIDLDPETLL
jgi:hypothetical protein